MTTETIPDNQPFGFFGAEALGDPFPVFAMLRKSQPVMRLPGSDTFWGVFRYDDVLRILRDPETFSSMVDGRSMRGEKRAPTILFDDPPMHTRMRGILAKAFTPSMIELQRDAIRANALRMIEGMLATDQPADLIEHLAYPLPVMVIAAMLGVEDGDMATFKRWSDAIIGNVAMTLMDPENDDIADVNREFDAYFKVRLNELRARPENNLLSELVHAETDEGRLSEEDLLVVCRVLLVAGNETTTGLIVNSIKAIDRFPDVLPRLKAEPRLISSMVEETLRYFPPFPATIRRTTRDVEVSGVTIPKDNRLLAMLASANHDETAFDRAEEFLVDRDPNRHLGFGMGIHFCLGAPLARLEGNIAMDLLVPRITALTIESAEDDGVLKPGGPSKMMVRFDRDSAFRA